MKRHPLMIQSVLATALAFSLCVAAAPVLQVSSDGELTGAKGVLVAGNLYDVEFVDGQCRDAVLSSFSDPPQCYISLTTFAFSNPTGAIAASQALLDQVFVDGAVVNGIAYDFDAAPWLTAGCEANRCSVFTPYVTSYWVGYEGMFNPKIYAVVDLAYATNQSLEADTVTAHLQLKTSDTTVGVPDQVWARWKPAAIVPEPSTLALLGAGLAAWLAARSRGQRTNWVRALRAPALLKRPLPD